jgi:hypothetical protein
LHPPGIPEMLVNAAEVVEGATDDEAVVETMMDAEEAADDEAVVETMMDEEEAAAWILNGKDHWKVLASESRKIAIP